MEMNFPHESLTQTSADTDVNADSTHDVLIAHAIARQSLSPSARAYIAQQSGMAAKSIHTGRGLMGDRIKFFAGELRPGSLFVKSEHIFENGHFRPDLLCENLSGEADKA